MSQNFLSHRKREIIRENRKVAKSVEGREKLRQKIKHVKIHFFARMEGEILEMIQQENWIELKRK